MVAESRDFVLYRNDAGIPADRKIDRIETGADSPEDYPKVSIIIPTSDGYRGGYFPALLKQLSEQSFQNFETIIIQGDPRQGRAINTGAEMAKGRYLLTLDDDTNLQSMHALEKLVKIMERDPTIGMAGGINVIPEEAPFLIRRAMREIPRRTTPPVDQVTESDLAEHPLLLIRKDVFLMVGGENELIPRGLDPYLRYKFREAGYKVVVVPGASYSHLPPSTFARLIKQFYRNGKQAAFGNRFYPQWMIETPENHVKDFVEKRPFLYRASRYLINILKKALKGHCIYLSVYTAYAIGFVWGYLSPGGERDSQ